MSNGRNVGVGCAVAITIVYLVVGPIFWIFAPCEMLGWAPLSLAPLRCVVQR